MHAWQEAHKGLGTLATVAGDCHHFHAQLVELEDDLLQAGQIVLAHRAVLASVHHDEVPLARGCANLQPASLCHMYGLSFQPREDVLP